MARILPTTWSNPDLILFHGTTSIHRDSIISGISVTVGRSRTDFGKGFYTTTNLSRAEIWASKKSEREGGSLPVVLQFQIPREAFAALATLSFARADVDALDYWDFLTYCRSGGPHHARAEGGGWYDVVIGPLAISTKNRDYYTDSDQISFHTTAGQILLNSAPKGVVS